MNFKQNFSIAAETLTAIAVVAILVAACGAGSSGGGATSTNATITPFKGPFLQGATVDIRDANGNLVSLLSGGTINSNGVANVSYSANVSYPLTVEVTGSYYNEISGVAETTSIPLRGLITDANAASAVPVTLVTETAVENLESALGSFAGTHTNIPAVSAVAALSLAANELGISSTSVPVFNPVTHLAISADAIQLAAFAKIANDTQSGGNLAAKITALANAFATLNPASAPTDVISQTTINNALNAVTSGSSSVMAVGITAPNAPIINSLYVDSIPVTGVNPLRAGTIANWNAYQVSPSIVATSTFSATSMFAKVESIFIQVATAAQSVFQTWLTSDGYSYGVTLTTQGADRYAMYYGGQYYGLKKIAADGTLTDIIPDTGGSGLASEAVAKDGSVYVGGTNNAPFMGLRKIDQHGNILWTYNIAIVSGVGDQFVNAINFDSNGYVYFVYSTVFAGSTLNKIDTNGNIIWSKPIGLGYIPSGLFGLNTNSTGNPLFIIHDQIFIFGDDNAVNGNYIAKFDTNGNQLSLKQLGPVSGSNLIILPNGNMVMKSSNANSTGGTLLLLDSNGNTIKNITDNILNMTALLGTFMMPAGPCPLGPSDPNFGITCGPTAPPQLQTQMGYYFQYAELVQDSGGNFYVGALNPNSDASNYYIYVNKYNQSGKLLNSYSIKAFQNGPGPVAMAVDSNDRLNVFSRDNGLSYLGDTPSAGYYFEADVRLHDE